MYNQPARGIRKSSAVITVAAGATPEVLYQLTNRGTVTRTVILRKIMCYSAVGNCILRIGTGLAPLVPIIPFFVAINGVDTEWTENDIPEVEVSADLTVQSSVLGVQVQVEVEEIGA